jgi:hypothetical protein
VHRYRRYVALRSTVIHYELSDAARRNYGVLTRLGHQIARCGQVQHLDTRRLAQESTGAYNGGGNALLPAAPAKLDFKAPAGLKSNLIPLRLKGKKLALYFYPDHVLVQSPKGFEAVPYPQLRVEIGFVDYATTRPPPDATLVAQTWRHVNPRGLPDRRYEDNHKVPVYKFVRARFRSWSGLEGAELDEVFDFSREAVAQQLSGFLKGIAGVAWTR